MTINRDSNRSTRCLDRIEIGQLVTIGLEGNAGLISYSEITRNEQLQRIEVIGRRDIHVNGSGWLFAGEEERFGHRV